MKYENILGLIGNTPLIRLTNSIGNKTANVYAKIEKGNISGSIKDRAAYQMIIDLMKNGKIQKGSTIIEPTSGNTGIGLACLSNYFDLHCIIVMPSSMSVERRTAIKNYGAELVLVDGGMKECVSKAQELEQQIKGSVIVGQFENDSNAKAHYLTTGPEIYSDLKEVDVIIAGIGTGGTITGIGKYFKEVKPSVEIIGIEPFSSPLITKGIAGSHKIQGIGANFIPKVLNLQYVDQVLTVKDEDAIEGSKELLKKEGLLVGISSGATFACAKKLLNDKKYENKNIVLIMPDSGERYTWN